MACYSVEESNGNFYVIESVSYWDKNVKQPRTKKNNIGKIEKSSGKIIFKCNFLKSTKLNFMTLKGQLIDMKKPFYDLSKDNKYKKIQNKFNKTRQQNSNSQLFDIDNDEHNDKNLNQPVPFGTTLEDIKDFKIFGSNYFIKEIATKIKILDVLKIVFPLKWEFIFTLMSFIILENKRMDHCIDWVEENDTFPVSSMSSQRISDLFNDIKQSERQLFYKKWMKIVKENDYIALDITSISSESKKIEEVEFGHSKENKKLPQFNLCMLYGQNSYLPMFHTIYQGSLTDVSTLSNTLNEYYGIIGDFNFQLVMDRGFYSHENIEFMLSKNELKFIIGVPLSNNYAKQLVKITNEEIKNIDNYVKTTNNGDNIKGIQKIVYFGDKSIQIINDTDITYYDHNKILFVYIYLNNNKSLRESNKFCNKVDTIKNEIIKNRKTVFKHQEFIKKYLTIEYSADNKNIVNIKTNYNEVEEYLLYKGYTVLLTNFSINTKDCYISYVKKDAVEKSFHNYKAYLGLDRPYTHGSKRMVNKTFIIYLCQILYSHIYKSMLEKNYFKVFSIPKLFNQLKKLKSFRIRNQKFLRPISKSQKDIFDHFNIKYPSL
jgi:transposase